MMDIKKLTIAFVFIGMMFGCRETERPVYDTSDGEFVRFTLALDSDGKISDQLKPSLEYTEEYTHTSFTSIDVPVSMTSEPLNETLSVTYSADIIGDYQGAIINPENTLQFSGTQLVDTINIQFDGRWNTDPQNEIVLILEECSDPNITIGNDNGITTLDTLRIELGEVLMNYTLSSPNMVEVLGEQDEKIQFSILFPEGMLVDEIEGIELFQEVSADFEYELTQLEIQSGATQVDYELTLVNNIQVDSKEFMVELELVDIANYTKFGNTKFTVIKPKTNDSDNSLNVAANFYNLSDPYYKTYGFNWVYRNSDEACSWWKYSTFTYPVEVSADHPNAVLDDKGTSDTSDDKYYHAFRIGFDSPNEGRTTNPFNFKGWFSDESTEADLSPGFNIIEAIEFYPKDGKSETEGDVIVIEQDLVIASITSKIQYTFHMTGSGTYNIRPDGNFEIILSVTLNNDELFGGDQTGIYEIYNFDIDKDIKPEEPDAVCIPETTL